MATLGDLRDAFEVLEGQAPTAASHNVRGAHADLHGEVSEPVLVTLDRPVHLRRSGRGPILVISVAVLALVALAAVVVPRLLPSGASGPTPPAGGPVVRVAVAQGCPELSASFSVANSGSDLISRLVPTGTPSAGLVCTYTDDNLLSNDRIRLTSQKILNPTDAARLGDSIHKIDLVSKEGGKCPPETLSATLIALTYPGRADVDLRFLTTGCQTLDNGAVAAGEYDNESFYGQFATTYAKLGL